MWPILPAHADRARSCRVRRWRCGGKSCLTFRFGARPASYSFYTTTGLLALRPVRRTQFHRAVVIGSMASLAGVMRRPTSWARRHALATAQNLLGFFRSVAGEPGFEPRQTESESVVLPLHHSPMDYPVLSISYVA